MPDLSPRLPCPVCLGAAMDRVALGPGGALRIDHCRRCGGAWLEHGEVQQLRSVAQAELWSQVQKRSQAFIMRCHDCHGLLRRAEEKCTACGWGNALDCPACGRPMRTESHAGLRLDVCRGCRGVWFDHPELEAIWGAKLGRLLRRPPAARGGRAAAVADGGGDLLLDPLFYATDLPSLGVRAAGHAFSASADAVSHVPDLVAAAPEAASTAFTAVGEASASVFEAAVEIVAGLLEGIVEVIVAVVCGIFDGL